MVYLINYIYHTRSRMGKNGKSIIKIFVILSVVMFFIMLSLHFVYLKFDFQTINQIHLLLKTQGISAENISDIENFIKTFDDQTNVAYLEILGVIISIWAGLNIYNLVNRENIEDIESIVKNSKKELEEFKEDCKILTLEKLEEKSAKENRIKQYYVKEIKENCIKTLSYTTLKKIVSVEDTMNAVIENYNAENYIEMETSLSIFKNKIEELKNELKIENTKEYINESNVAENIMKSYINCKKGEYYYYRGMLFLNAKNNILEGEECLEKADKYYELSIFEKNENSEIVNQYLYNVRAYINQILYKYNKNEDKQKAKENVKRAVRFSQKACENYGNTRYSKDYRNYGANIELELTFENNDEGKNIQTSDWIKRMKEAYHQYELAKNIDNNDVKTLTCLASNILKQFDKAVDLDGHLDNLKYTCDLDKKELLKALKKYNIDVNDINKAYNYLVRAQVNDVNNDAAHYHMIHVYMYKIILSDTPKEKERLIYKAKNEIAYCEAYYFENNPSIAFLYKAYKFYCVNNYKNRAKLYWEEIQKKVS